MMSNLTIQQKLRAMGGYFDNATETQISCKDVADYIDALQAELAALRQQLASSEPVAWMIGEVKTMGFVTPTQISKEQIPLYTHPQSASVDELVRLLEEAKNELVYLGLDEEFTNEIEDALAKYKKGEAK